MYMRVLELIKDVNIVSIAENISDTEITDICFNSKQVGNGSIFVCIKGEKEDGHSYALNAQQNGAAVIVACHQTNSTLPHIIVKDSRAEFFTLCANFFGNIHKKMRFIGVTGTNGKTSTTFFIKDMLDSLGIKTGLIGTVKNMIGKKQIESTATTPEPYTLFKLLSQMYNEGVDCVVMEVSSHSLAQGRISGIEFDVGVFTNLSQDHLDYHGTMDNYKAVKAKLFSQSKAAVINIDDSFGACLAKDYNGKAITYSVLYDNADLVAKDIRVFAGGTEFVAVMIGSISRISVSTAGYFTVLNTLAAIGALCALGFNFDEAAYHTHALKPVPGRAQIVDTDTPYTVIIDYAHTPDGLENILSSVRRFAKARLITLFGCGGDRDKTKRPLMARAAAKYSDYLVITSDNPRTENPTEIIKDILTGIDGQKPPYKVIENRKEAIAYALGAAQKDDIVVLAGKGHENYQILAQGRIEFDEEKIIREILGKQFER